MKARLEDKKYLQQNFFDLLGEQKENSEEQANNGHSLDLSKVAIERVDWFPDGLAFVANLSRENMRKHPGLKKLQRFINFATDSGLLTRQELVSMIPPLFLDLQPSDIVLDMCAAPGSKTSQMLESISGGYVGGVKARGKGGVVANDADSKRAFMLTHQLQRIDTSGMLVINHEGQHLPTIKKSPLAPATKAPKFYYDKVLADVPCSGDGAIRKLPAKWRGWHTKDGYGLHQTQASILQRALELVKEGGLVMYSTCSLSPIENEAVVAKVVSKALNLEPNSVEVLDVHGKFDGLKGRRGLLKWDVLVEKPDQKQNKNQESSQYKVEDLFEILSTYDEKRCSELSNMIKGSF